MELLILVVGLPIPVASLLIPSRRANLFASVGFGCWRRMYRSFRVQPVIFPDQFPACFAGPVMTPTRRLDKIVQAIFQRSGSPGFAEKLAPGLEGYNKGIKGSNVPCQPILRAFFFLLESAEQPVPYDKDPGMVLIQVFEIDGMMYPVMGWGIENKFYRTGKSPDGLRMDPELIDQADRLHHQDDQWMEAQQRHPAPEKKGAGEIARPGLSQGGRQVISFGGMMHDMRSPEPVDVMAAPVKPIVGEIIGEKSQHPMPPAGSIQGE